MPDREQVERVAEWLYNNDSATGGSWPPATTRPENVEYWRDKARELLALLADREQGEALERWTLARCRNCGQRWLENPHNGYTCLSDCTESDVERIEVVPAPADREGEQDAEWPELVIGRVTTNERDHYKVMPEAEAYGLETRTYIPEGEVSEDACPTCHGEPVYREGTIGPQTVGLEPRGRVFICPDCGGTGKGVSEDSGEQLRDFKASGGALRVSEDSVRVVLTREEAQLTADDLFVAASHNCDEREQATYRSAEAKLRQALTDQGKGDGDG